MKTVGMIMVLLGAGMADSDVPLIAFAVALIGFLLLLYGKDSKDSKGSKNSKNSTNSTNSTAELNDDNTFRCSECGAVYMADDIMTQRAEWCESANAWAVFHECPCCGHRELEGFMAETVDDIVFE